jgi:hypothetical protein
MSDAKHTPGPWRVESVNGPYPHDICLGYDVPGAGSPYLLASVFDDENDPPPALVDAVQANANARLIAASPDLYEACRALLDAVRQDNRGLAEAWNKAVAALAKAEGREGV